MSFKPDSAPNESLSLHKPRVSVLMPVYNTARYLGEALRSISAQTFDDFELVVIDDGSTDDSLAVLQAYADSEPRMRLVSRENRGLVATRNELLRHAKGALTAWMDSDDVSSLDRLERQVQWFDAAPGRVCVSGSVQNMDSDGNPFEIESFPEQHADVEAMNASGGGMRFGASMMVTALAIELGGFRTPFAMGEDFDLLLRLGERGEVGNLPVVLLQYRRHASSTSSQLASHWGAYRALALQLAAERRSQGSDRLQRGEAVEIDLGAIPVESPSLAPARRARSALRNGHRRVAWKQAIAALRADPASPIGWRAVMHVARGILIRG